MDNASIFEAKNQYTQNGRNELKILTLNLTTWEGSDILFMLILHQTDKTPEKVIILEGLLLDPSDIDLSLWQLIDQAC